MEITLVTAGSSSTPHTSLSLRQSKLDPVSCFLHCSLFTWSAAAISSQGLGPSCHLDVSLNTTFSEGPSPGIQAKGTTHSPPIRSLWNSPDHSSPANALLVYLCQPASCLILPHRPRHSTPRNTSEMRALADLTHPAALHPCTCRLCNALYR